MARVEMKIVLEEFFKCFPKMRLVQPDTVSHLHTFVFRAPDSLRVRLRWACTEGRIGAQPEAGFGKVT